MGNCLSITETENIIKMKVMTL